jgi:hypothetical protein
VYGSAGNYPVSLSVGDGSTVLTDTQADFIRVLQNPGLPMPWSEGFEDAPQLDDWWRARNPDGDNGFEITNAAAFTGSRSVRLVNTMAAYGRSDELVSSTLNMSGTGPISLTFRYAYARRNPTDDDALYVYVSGDCGQTWVLRKVLRAITTLVTAPAQGGSFVPNGPGQWSEAVMTNIGASLLTSRFRVRFVFESTGGNNLYLDDINISSLGVGIDDAAAARRMVGIFPNPADAEAWVDLPNDWAGARWAILDATGRIMDNGHVRSADIGHAGWRLPIQGLVTGAYVLRLQMATQEASARFLVQ